VYHGLNDRRIQEKVSQIYHYHIPLLNKISPLLISPHISDSTSIPPPQPLPRRITTTTATTTTTGISSQRVRIGFMSKYFGIFEPHGLLLDGVIRYLPRKDFKVIVKYF